jgi:hypothetical protein
MDDFTDTKSQEKQTLQFVFLEELQIKTRVLEVNTNIGYRYLPVWSSCFLQ